MTRERKPKAKYFYDRYTLVYEYPTDDSSILSYIKAYIPNEGYYFFEVTVSTDTKLKGIPYYVIARSEVEAYSLLKDSCEKASIIIQKIKKCEPVEALKLIINYYRKPVIII